MDNILYKIEKYNSKIMDAYNNSDIDRLNNYSEHQTKYIKKLLKQNGGVKLGELATKINETANMIKTDTNDVLCNQLNNKIQDLENIKNKILLDKKKLEEENNELRYELDNKTEVLQGTAEYILNTLPQ